MAFTLYNGQAWWDRAGKRSGSQWLLTEYYQFAGQTIAMRNENGLTYLHSDHLGSTVLTTQGNTSTASQGYYAYGQVRDHSGDMLTDHGFTGQKSDSATGLTILQQPLLRPDPGTFISPDTIVPMRAGSWHSTGTCMFTGILSVSMTHQVTMRAGQAQTRYRDEYLVVAGKRPEVTYAQFLAG